MKYRIKIITNAAGQSRYLPQVKVLFVWVAVEWNDYSGSTCFSDRESALAVIEKDIGRKIKSVCYENIG